MIQCDQCRNMVLASTLGASGDSDCPFYSDWTPLFWLRGSEKTSRVSDACTELRRTKSFDPGQGIWGCSECPETSSSWVWLEHRALRNKRQEKWLEDRPCKFQLTLVSSEEDTVQICNSGGSAVKRPEVGACLGAQLMPWSRQKLIWWERK